MSDLEAPFCIMPDRKFPFQNGKPVLITREQFGHCCCRWCCDEHKTYYPGAVNLLMRYPSAKAPDKGFWPYPNGIICLGPFDVTVDVFYESDLQVFFDDWFLGGEVNECQQPEQLYYHWYGNVDGTPIKNKLATIFPGQVFSFTVASDTPIAVGVGINPSGQPGTYSKITWNEA